MFARALQKCVLAAAVTVTQVAAAEPASSNHRVGHARVEMSTVAAENLLGEISDWLAQNFELAATPERPAIRFLSQAELQEMRNRAVQDGTQQLERESVGEGSAASGVGS